jgi:acyl carrier protein
MPGSIQSRLRTVVEKIANKPVPDDPEESLFESGLLDSFALTDVVGAMEEEFGIKVPDADLTPRKFDSIARMEAYIVQSAGGAHS